MSIKVSEHYQGVVLKIKGKFLGSVAGKDFKSEVDRLKSNGKTKVVIDLSETDFMDSSGIGALIRALTTMRNADGDVKLAGLNDRIKNLFVITRLLGPVFENYDNVDAALESFGQPAEA